MRAVEYDAYGAPDVMRVCDVAEPGRPEPGRVSVRVIAASVNPKDTFVRKGRFRALTGERFPRRTGYDFSGAVQAVGQGVDGLSVGQPVFGMLNGWEGGACVEHLIVPADELAAAPSSTPLAHAAAIPLAALTALQALSDIGRLRRGSRALINGASGGVGLFAIQIAKALDAQVTAVASSSNERLCRDAGADAFVDYRMDDPLMDAAGAFNVVFDVFGNRSFGEARSALSTGGVYVSTVPNPQIFADMAATRDNHTTRARLVMVESRRTDLDQLARWADAGALHPVIDSDFDLASAPLAHQRVETKHTRGKVLISVAERS